MKRSRCRLIALALLSAITAGAAGAQVVLKPSDLPEREQAFLKRGPEQLLNRLLNELQRHGPDRVATPETSARLARIAHAKLRFRFIGQHLRMDLDGDGSLTDDELQLFAGLRAEDANATSRVGRQLARLRAKLAEIDGDKDGRAAFGEISAFAERQIAERAAKGRSRAPVDMMVFDLNGDPHVDTAEVTKAVTMLAVANGGSAGGSALGGTACPAPPPPRAADFLLLGTHRGGSLASVAIGRMEDATTVVRLKVGPGDKPLAILAVANSNVIWHLSGATDRVRQFTVQATPFVRLRSGRGSERAADVESGAGVIGLAGDVVHFVPAMSCIKPFSSVDDSAATIGAARLAAQFGRPVDHVFHHSGAGVIEIPTGTVQVSARGLRGKRLLIDGKQHIMIRRKPVMIDESTDHAQAPKPKSVDAVLQRYIDREFPGGIMEVDPVDVVAPGPVATYDVLPGTAGLLQLIETGLIRRHKDGFLIDKPIPRFPPGLHRGKNVKFFLAAGIAMPDGDPGRATVFSQETGACLAGPLCPK